MSVEVLPAGGGNTRRKMGRRFVGRWICLGLLICTLLWYFLLNKPWKIPTDFSGKSVTKSVTGPIVVHIDEEIAARQAAAGTLANLFPVDPDSVKTVLFWTKFFGTPDPRGSLGPKLFEGCPVHQCMSTTDQNLVKSSDAVVFHALDVDPAALPGKRSPKQHYIFFIGESPANAPTTRIPATPENFYDMTFTYRLDSDVLGHYLYSVPVETGSKNFATGKTKLVAWFVSNCPTHSKREDYVKKLQKYVSVDVYGKCGTLTCSRNDESACNALLKKDYKFYLSFENSMCRDYVTEKFTNALLNDVIPIVLGDGNFTIFPPNSYLHIDNYSSIESLADYLKYLDKNDTAYNEYMKWRYVPELVASHGQYSPANSNWCKLCERLHDPAYQSKDYLDARAWWIDGGKCRAGSW